MGDVADRIEYFQRRALTAEARARELEGMYETSHASRLNAEAQWRQERTRATAAEAREQALRDRVGELADEWDREGDVGSQWLAALVWASDQLRRALLSPPTADTEESDR